MNFTNEDEMKIVDMYVNQKLSTVKIGQYYNCYYKVVAKILDKHNIQRVGNGRRKYDLDEHYFDKIDTPNKAYILGLLFADGNNSLEKSTIRISLKESDKDILERMRKEFKLEKPLRYQDNSNDNHNGYISKNAWILDCFSSHMCKTLNQIGMKPNKSLILEFPQIEEHLYSHFVRGYYDGNGSVYRTIKSPNNHHITTTITSTEMFCNSLAEICTKKLDIYCPIYDASNHNGITKVFTLSGRNKSKKFLDWIYQDADMYLARKYDRYKEYYFLD